MKKFLKDFRILIAASALTFLVGIGCSFAGFSVMFENSESSSEQTAQAQSSEVQTAEDSNKKMAVGTSLYAFGALNLAVAGGLNGLRECGQMMRDEEEREEEIASQNGATLER